MDAMDAAIHSLSTKSVSAGAKADKLLVIADMTNKAQAAQARRIKKLEEIIEEHQEALHETHQSLGYALIFAKETVQRLNAIENRNDPTEHGK